MLQDGTVCRYKARLVVKGLLQGYTDHTYAPVVGFATIRCAPSIAVSGGYAIIRLDVQTAFLHADIDSDVYRSLPEGFNLKRQGGQAFKLHKGLYGLKQAPTLWYDKWNSVMRKLGFKALVADSCVYRKGNAWILLYVYDVIVIGSEETDLDEVKKRLSGELDFTCLGTLGSFLGAQFTRDGAGAWLGQRQFFDSIIERFGMRDCKPVKTHAFTESPH